MAREYQKKAWLMGGILLSSLIPLQQVQAQIAADGSLSTQVFTPDNLNYIITEGDRSGNNLFHSFSEFSIPSNGEAFFDNTADIQNIFSRVTGGFISKIDGTLSANGTANFFLLNPQGIIFGPNAELAVGGSFIATSAESLRFADGTEFSATNPGNKPILTQTAPIGLQYGSNPGTIVNQSVFTPPAPPLPPGVEPPPSFPVGLQINPGQTLALLGGEVKLEGGVMLAPAGNIEVGSVGDNGFVQINSESQNFFFSYQGVENFQNISLSQEALIDVSSLDLLETGGDVRLEGNTITLSERSQISSLTIAALDAGTIAINARELIQIIGNRKQKVGNTNINTVTFGDGDGGDVKITTKRLILQDGGQILTDSRTFFLPNNQGNSGNLTIEASESVEIFGISVTSNLSRLSVRTLTRGNAGKLTITTPQLIVRDGGEISAATSSQGQGGTLDINADSVLVTGSTVNPNGEVSVSTIKVSSEGAGNAGNLTITSSELTVRDGGEISASTAGNGDGGEINISTQRLLLEDGARVFTNSIVSPSISEGQGNSGNLRIDASDSVEIAGNSATGNISELSVGTSTSGKAGNLTITTPELIVKDGGQVSAATLSEGQGGTLDIQADAILVTGSSLSPDGEVLSSTIRASSEGSGSAGDLIIKTKILTVENQGAITVSGEGAGAAGNLAIEASDIFLDNRGSLRAETAAGDKGSISLITANNIELRNNSSITTEATGNASGGNIFMDTKFLIALENSNIIANAVLGSGGNIQINAEGIFKSEDSIIDASSQLGVDGIIEVNTPDVQLESALEQLKSNFVPADQIIASSCLARRNADQGRFVVTGTGGLPYNPDEPMRGYYQITEIESLPDDIPENQSEIIIPQNTWKPGQAIQEAEKLTMTNDGRIVLVTNSQVSKADQLICH